MNTTERSVLKDDDCLELTTKTFDVLQYLIENAGKVLTKDEILGTVWSGNFVEESNLPVHISKLRKSLGESPDNRFIETVQGTGYRFVAPVRQADEDEWLKILRGRKASSDHTTNNGPESICSIAVMPLRNETGDATNDYLIDGLSENIINNLSLVGALRVLARNTVFRYRDIDEDVLKVAKILGVSKVVTGRVRLSDNGLIVGVELINAVDGAQLWGSQYACRITDIISVQEEISFSLVERLTTSSRRRDLFANSLTRDPESYRLYLKGRFLLEKHSVEDIYAAIEYFNKSLSLDPTNIHAYAEIVECYRSLYIFEYLTYAEFLTITKPILSAVSTGNEDTDVVQVMYCDLKMLEWKFEDAANHCHKALAINPNSLKGRLRYSDILMQSRNFVGALKQLEKLIVIDPLSALLYKRLGRLFWVMGQHDVALAYLNDALDLEPFSHEALALKGVIYSDCGDYKEALRNYEDSLRAQHQIEILAMIGVVHAKQGNAAKARAVLVQVENESTHRAGYGILLAHLHFAMGEKENGYAALDRAFAQHEPDIRALTYDRRWNPIRGENRFRALVDKAGLPSISETVE